MRRLENVSQTNDLPTNLASSRGLLIAHLVITKLKIINRHYQGMTKYKSTFHLSWNARALLDNVLSGSSHCRIAL